MEVKDLWKNGIIVSKLIVDDFYLGHKFLFQKRMKEIEMSRLLMGDNLIRQKMFLLLGIERCHSELQKEFAENYLLGKVVDVFSEDSVAQGIRVKGIEISYSKDVLFLLKQRPTSCNVIVSEKMKIKIIGDIPPLKFAL